ncbi:hypothetical protein Nepgr_025837 [Nepenthes gracilis]|uniref:Uncharacterized protein n=1 Tax=Nepenthes gracilis TaxID=150966 RepID=A0AAD3T795_NEPGR|nr:hypothetical protein Nepgr_025837 [Nepenthes gracilis]
MEEGIGSRFTAGGEPPAPSVETPREPKIMGIVPEEPLIYLADVGKDTTMMGIMEASPLETPVSNPVASSFHPSPRGNGRIENLLRHQI